MPTADLHHIIVNHHAQANLFEMSAWIPPVRSFAWSEQGDAVALSADIDAPDGLWKLEGDFRGSADVLGSTDEFVQQVSALMDNVPSSFEVIADGSTYRVLGTDGLDADVDARIGWLQAFSGADAPHWYAGVSLNDYSCDAADGCRPTSETLYDGTKCFGYWGRLVLRGAPGDVLVDTEAGYVQLLGFDPADLGGVFEARVLLTHTPSSPIDLLVQQSGIPSPVDLRFGPITAANAPDGSETVTLQTAHSADLGQLVIQVRVPSDDPQEIRYAELVVSNVPAALDASARWGSGFSLDVAASSSIGQLTARLSENSVSAPGFASAVLTDLPTEFQLDVHESPEADDRFVLVPLFDYTGSASTLDVALVMDPPFVSDPLRQVRFWVDDLGASSRLEVSPGLPAVGLTSSPPTGAIQIAGQFNIPSGEPATLCERDDLDDVPVGRLRVDGSIEVRELSGTAHLLAEDVQSLVLTFGRAPEEPDGGTPSGFEMQCDNPGGGGSAGADEQPPLAMALGGEFSQFDLWLDDDFVLDLDIDLEVVVEKRPYWSWLVPLFELHVDEDDVFNHLMFNVLDTPFDTEPDPRATRQAVCLRFAAGPITSPIGSLSLSTHPAPYERFIDGVSLPAPTDGGNWEIGFLNPIGEDESSPTGYSTLVNPDLIDLVTAQIGPIQQKLEHAFHDSTTC